MRLMWDLHDSLLVTMNEATIEKAVETYRRTHRSMPEVIVRAPGRVNLIGEHIDYNGGSVLPIAIDHATIVAAGRSDADGRSVEVNALDVGRRNVIEDLPAHHPRGHDSEDGHLDYIIGPLKILLEKGIDPRPMNCTISSDIPIGAGLSSSAALEVGMLLAARTLVGRSADPKTLAEEAMESEHRFAGTPCGIMDMFVSAAAESGHACLIDCIRRTCRQITLPDSDRLRIVITDTGVRHALADGAYADRRHACETSARLLGVGSLSEVTRSEFDEGALPKDIRSRARHVITEIDRVDRFIEALEAEDLPLAGNILGESHRSLRDDYEVSCPELDMIVEVADSLVDAGVYGSRMTGGGFGGCVVSLCDPNAVEPLRSALSSAYQSRYGRPPSIFETDAGPGAACLD